MAVRDHEYWRALFIAWGYAPQAILHVTSNQCARGKAQTTDWVAWKSGHGRFRMEPEDYSGGVTVAFEDVNDAFSFKMRWL